MREYLSGITRPTWEGHITPEDALNDVVAMLDTYEMLEDGPVVTDTLIALCREVVVNSRQQPSDSRRQHCRHHARPRRA